MKQYLFVFFLFFSGKLLSQIDDAVICHVLSVKGEIRKPWDSVLQIRDTIQFKYLKELKYISEASSLIIYQPGLGRYRLSKKEVENSSSHENFFAFVQHLLKISGRRVTLSSRGNCECVTPSSCFATDTAFNDKILLTDSFLFVADNILQTAEKATYYLQYQSKKRVLNVTDGYVRISPADFVFRDTSFTTGETPEFIIGLYVRKDNVESSSLIAKVKFNIVSIEELQQYYSALKSAMEDGDLKKTYEEFGQDVYLFFGKPTECQLEKIINTIK